MRDEKTEMKILKAKDDVKFWLNAAEKYTNLYNGEKNERKREKAKKHIESAKKSIQYAVNKTLELGGSLEDLIESFSEIQTSIWKELYGESDTDMIGVEKEITRIKKLLNEDLKKAMEKTDYDPADPIQDKMKNRRFSEEAHIGAHLASASRKNDFVGDGLNKEYNPYWNYQRDYESTKDKYFTEEEQRLIEKCRESHKEQYAYLLEKRAWMGKMGESLIETAGKMREWGDITQAKIWSKNLYNEVFPITVKSIYGQLPREEKIQKSKEMTKRFIQFIADPEAIKEAMEIHAETEREADELEAKLEHPELLSAEDSANIAELRKYAREESCGERILVLYLLERKIGLEKTIFITLYNYDKHKELRRELLNKFTFEELGL